MTGPISLKGPSDPVRLPAHELVYRDIRDQILFGEFEPGQPVTIQGLTDALGVGMTPVREALRRLTAEGALEFLGNRRIAVPVPARRSSPNWPAGPQCAQRQKLSRTLLMSTPAWMMQSAVGMCGAIWSKTIVSTPSFTALRKRRS